MGENEEFPFSQMLTDLNSIHRSIMVENEYVKKKKEYLKEIESEYAAVTKDITHLEALKKEKLDKKNLIGNSIESAINTQQLQKEHNNSLFKELEIEQNKTAEKKKEYDSIISKYEAKCEQYKEVYEKLSYVREMIELRIKFNLKRVQLKQRQVEVAEMKQKCQVMAEVRERMKKLEIVNLAEAYVLREAASKKKSAVVQEIRKLKDEIEAMKIEKQRLMDLRVTCQTERHIPQDILSAPFPYLNIDISCLNIPQLQFPLWNSPPRKIPCHEQRERNMRPAVVRMDTSSANQNAIDITTRDVGSILNPQSGFQIRGQDIEEVTALALITSMIAKQDFLTDSYAAETAVRIKRKISKVAPNPAVTVDRSNEAQPCEPLLSTFDETSAITGIQPQPNSEQSMHECMDQTPEFPSTADRTDEQILPSHSTQAAAPVISTQQAVASAATPEAVYNGGGGGDTLGSAVQKVDERHKVGPGGDYQESPMEIVDHQPTSDHSASTLQSAVPRDEPRCGSHFFKPCSKFSKTSVSEIGNKSGPEMESMACAEKTVQNDPGPSQTTAIEVDNVIDMNIDESHCLSPTIDEDIEGLDPTLEGDPCQVDYHFNGSSEDCCALSPPQNFVVCSPEEPPNSSPPFVISPEFQATNINLFGTSSNQQNNSGFAFNFGASNTGGAGGNVAGGEKPSEGFQFNFNKKTSSKSFFQLF